MNDLWIRPRLIGPTVSQALRRFPVVVLTGARQTGKSTLVEAPPVGKSRVYRSLDDFDVLDRAQASPDFLVREAPRLTIDEVQHAPSLLLEIKRFVDRDRTAGRFLLTGSQNLLMMRRISESLAGRAVYLTLWPMTESEKRGSGMAAPWGDLLKLQSPAAAERRLQRFDRGEGWEWAALSGGYPVPALQLTPADRSRWFEGYVRTYLERDLQELSSVSALSDFRRLMKLSALRVGQMLNQTELARDAALSQPTTHRYLNLLETSYQIVRIPAFAARRTKRLVKTPKLFWTDTGLAAHLAGVDSPAELDDTFGGALLENLILVQLLVWRETLSPRPEIHYFRTHAGEEIDFVIEWKRRLLPIEVKRSRRIRTSAIDSVVQFIEEYRERAHLGIVLYGGREVIRLGDRVLGVPLSIALG